jgi:hypothetical protein
VEFPTGRCCSQHHGERRRLLRRHNAIFLAVFGEFRLNQKDIAKATGYSPSQVSRILCSPEFQVQYDVRMQEAAFVARSKWLSSISKSN